MILYYFRIAFRHLRKSFSYSFINIAGLAIGIASILLIFLYVQHELSFDNYHEKGDRIYRLVEYHESRNAWGSIPEGAIERELRIGHPDVEEAAALGRGLCNTSGNLRLSNTTYSGISFVCAEPNLFNIFSFEMTAGSPEGLDAPNTAVISESIARRLYGEENPVGKSFTAAVFPNGEQPMEVVGVMKDIPENSHFRTDIFLSYRSMSEDQQEQAHHIYLLLKDGADTEQIADQALQDLHRIRPGQNHITDIKLEPLKDIYFSEIHAQRQGDIQYIYILSAIALVILLVACGNYMNLATARYSRRSREIGIRKVLGAYRMQLVRQFLSETILLTVVALPIALLLVELATPWFNSYAATGVDLVFSQNFVFYGITLLVLIGTGILAGSYPAFVSSAYHPKTVLQGNSTGSLFSGSGLLKGLVSFQFFVSLAMIGITTIILQQLDFMQNKNLGFDSDQIVTVSMQGFENRSKAGPFKEELLRMSTVSGAAIALPPGVSLVGSSRWYPSPVTSDTVTLSHPNIDADFLSVMKIPLLAGRNISDQIPGDTREVLINEAGVEAIGWSEPEQALNQMLGNHRIVGVIPDFHATSVKRQISPTIYIQYLRLRTNGTRSTGGESDPGRAGGHSLRLEQPGYCRSPAVQLSG